MTDLIGDAVRRELSRFGPAAGMAELLGAWPAAVGDGIARNAWPARIGRDGTLHVAVTSSAWAFELGAHGPEILGRLRETLGDDAPTALRFTPGRVPEPDPGIVPEAPAAVPRPTAGELAEAAAAAAAIEDPELRELVRRAAAASLAATRDDHPI
jgi:predicted nucleic acid-binding Zn ribbon protein